MMLSKSQKHSIVIIFIHSGVSQWDEQLQPGLTCDIRKLYGCQRSTAACKIKFPWVA